MSTTRRSLLTAAAAGALLGALSFVPSANATVTPERAEPRPANAAAVSAVAAADAPASGPVAGTAAHAGAGAEGAGSPAASTADFATDPVEAVGSGTELADTELADTGAFDTTPYVLGGTAFLGMGAAFLVYSVRRERMGF